MQFCTTDNSDAQYAVAKAKYDTYSGAAKDNCLEKSKADFGKLHPEAAIECRNICRRGGPF